MPRSRKLLDRALIPFEEIERLWDIEKRYLHSAATASKSDKSDDLEGAGAPGPSEKAQPHEGFPFALLPTPPKAAAEVLDLNASPPRAAPLQFSAQLDDNTERIRLQAKTDKSLPATFPVIDPLGFPLSPRPGTTKQPKEDTTQVGAGGSSSRTYPEHWYFGGRSLDANSDEEDES